MPLLTIRLFSDPDGTRYRRDRSGAEGQGAVATRDGWLRNHYVDPMRKAGSGLGSTLAHGDSGTLSRPGS